MIQKDAWHEYPRELKQFLCDVAKSRWAKYLYYPIGSYVAIMYTASQAGERQFTFFSLVCDFVGCISVFTLGVIFILTCIFTADYPYARLRKRNKLRDNQRLLAAFRNEYDKKTELRIQRDHELVRRKVVTECQKQQKIQLDAIREQYEESLDKLKNELECKKQELVVSRNTFNQEVQNILMESEEKANELKRSIIQKEENIDELETQIAETQKSFDVKMEELATNHEREMELFRQKTIDELYTDEFRLFQKASDGYKASREKLIRDASEQVKVVTTYAVMDLAPLCFSVESIAFIQNKVCTFAETGGKFDKTEPSPLVNPFKDVDARKRGRKKKVNTSESILTTQDIAHYTKNIAVYLDYRLEDVVRFTEHLFKDWYGDGDFLSIAKAAAKSPDSGLIKIHEDLKAYVFEQGWM